MINNDVRPKRQSIAIIDDSRENILVLNEILKDLCEIIVATSGMEGLELVHWQNPDVVLLDVNLGDMDGFEVCRILKSDPKTEDIPIIFISALSEEGAEDKGLTTGAIDFIQKPFSPPIVKARVKNHLKMKEQSDILRNFSLTDGLTGIANRRQFEIYLDAEWRRCARTSAPFSVIMIDIDYFKPYNDTYGHLQGDECLKEVARVLAGAIQRPGDVIARYGGEEFIGLLPGIEINGAVHLAEKMRKNVSQLGMPHAASLAADHVTISAGAAMETSCRDKSPRDLVKAADDQLYRAKEAGRNRVMSSLTK
ncbi:MAG: diguanylate cyclase [Nitrospinae bacterium]|nr:diguanylate cyclase [Nitrospinota bacterium]